MKILFIICEGPHDAQFIGRLLQASGQYSSFDTKLGAYPPPLRQFISEKYTKQNVDDIRIGKPNFPLVPVCAFKAINADQLVLPVAMGGMDKYKDAISFVNETQNDFAEDILRQSKSKIEKVSFLFIYDADSRGIENTVKFFRERFEDDLKLTGNIIDKQWFMSNGFMSSLFIFTGDDGNTGTLEDNLLRLFTNSSKDWVHSTHKHIAEQFEPMTSDGDATAHTAKINKGILTTCGQIERSNAGYALTVVVRDTKLLDGAFDFSDQGTPWSQLLNLINGAFYERTK